MELTKDELTLLKWLSIDDGQYGECRGKALDSVMGKGFVEWIRLDPRGDDYGWVGLTAAGREAVRLIC
jgi:hypothetical protein